MNQLWCNSVIAFNLILLCYLFSFYTHGWDSPIFWIANLRICRVSLPRKFALAIFHENLPQEFAVGIWNRNLPWEFGVAICHGFFVYLTKSFFIWEKILYGWKQTFFIGKQYPFICDIFFINSVSSCDCRDSYGPPYQTILYKNYFKWNACLWIF